MKGILMISMMKHLLIVFVALLFVGSAAQAAGLVGFRAWGVHGVTTSDDGSGNILFQDGGTDYHWEDSWDTPTDHIRTGGKSFYSTDYLNGQTVAAIDTLTWTDVDNPDQGTPYVNVLVEYTTGGNTYTAILAANDATKNGNWEEMMHGSAGVPGGEDNHWDFIIYEGSDFDDDNSDSVFNFCGNCDDDPGPASYRTFARWQDVKDMTIIGGGQQLCPAAVTGGPGTADYSNRAANWAYWGDGAELDGLSFVWGARQLKDPFDGNAPIIGDITLNGLGTHTVPEPGTVAMIAMGALGMLGVLRRRLC